MSTDTSFPLTGADESMAANETEAILNALPQPVMLVSTGGNIAYANQAAESFFQASASFLKRHQLKDFVPFGSPLLALVDQARFRGAPVNEYHVDLSTPRTNTEQLVDLHVSPVPECPGDVLVMVQQRSMANKIDRQLTHRGAARSVSGMAAVLAHEIKNPLSGIRGAAQLLETCVPDGERELTRLITDETDRICKLVDRMEVFGDERPVDHEPVNIHTVLDRVKAIAETGFARHIHFVQDYDPSLPHLSANNDQLIQVFLNLVKNAAESIGHEARDGEIILSTAFRPGVRLSVPGSQERVNLPLEICVKDNGPGVPDDLIGHLFDPFVTTKSSGTGLGLALVAKIVRDHGGVIECDSIPRNTVFRILMPMYARTKDRAGAKKETSDA